MLRSSLFASPAQRPLLPRASRALVVVATLGLAVGCAPRAGQSRFSHPLLYGADGAPRASTQERTMTLDGRVPAETPQLRALRSEVSGVAASLVGQSRVVVDGKPARFDCSGVTRAIYAKAGRPLGGRALSASENDVKILFRYIRETGSLRRGDPRPGDLVFFDDTYDKNGDGRRNDPLTHVGVVERVLPDGTVVFVHQIGRGIVRHRMNLRFPHLRRDPTTGRTLNHYLRRGSAGAGPKTTGELFAGFGSAFVRADPHQVARR